MCLVLKTHFCKVCGRHPAYVIDNGSKQCLFCGTQNSQIESKYDMSYYREKSQQRFGSTIHDFTILDEEELFINPDFNKELYNKRREELSKVFSDPETYKPAHEYLRSTLPTCPTCHSTNIKKISLAKGYLHWRMFGFFSKTARSQWECLNCSHKW